MDDILSARVLAPCLCNLSGVVTGYGHIRVSAHQMLKHTCVMQTCFLKVLRTLKFVYCHSTKKTRWAVDPM